MRKIARIDSNQSEIVEALRGVGCSVISLAQHGNGLPDLLVGIPYGRINTEVGKVGYYGVNLLMEVKTLRGKHTPEQKLFFETWPAPNVTVKSIDEALQAIGVA